MTDLGAPMERVVVREFKHTARLVRARKRHWCLGRNDGCAREIRPGQMYIASTVYPGHDVIEVLRPRRDAFCLHCAGGYATFEPLLRTVKAAS
jgi:hypothetical protein